MTSPLPAPEARVPTVLVVEDDPDIAELVDSIFTEEGSFLPEEVAALVDRTPFLREGYSLLRASA